MTISYLLLLTVKYIKIIKTKNKSELESAKNNFIISFIFNKKKLTLKY